MPIDINTADEATLIRELDIQPSLAKKIIAARKDKPFAAKEELRLIDGMDNDALRRIEGSVTFGADGSSQDYRARLLGCVEKFCELSLAIPHTAEGERSIPPAANQLKFIVKGLLGDGRNDLDANTTMGLETLLTALEDELNQLEEAIAALMEGIAEPPENPKGFYERFLLSDIPDNQVIDIALSPVPILALNQSLGRGRGVLPVIYAATATDRLKAVADLLGKNKTKINAVLKLMAKLGGKAALLKYLASVLEALDDAEVIKAKPPAAGGSTEKCYADVYLTALEYEGQDVGDDLTLRFKINGTTKDVERQFSAGAALDTPILLRSFEIGGICGQKTNNVVNVEFNAIERDPPLDPDDIGEISTYAFGESCPSTESHEMLSLVREGSVSATITATVEVIKQCGASDVISV